MFRIGALDVINAIGILTVMKYCVTFVQGGFDQMMPVIVSRVAPNTPADLCIPRLSEGDQVLFVNGRDISQHTHAQVMQTVHCSDQVVSHQN